MTTSAAIRVRLGWGRAPRWISVPERTRVLVAQPSPTRPPDLPALLARALGSPIGAPRLAGRVGAGARVTIIVSDATREEPRGALVDAVLAELGVPVQATIAVANGTHAPGVVEALGLSVAACAVARVENHDGASLEGLVELGRTARGTPVRLPRTLVESELVIATGRIRPHYFAGFGAGAKAIFPGLGFQADIRTNHRLKQEPGARLGVVEDNPCRADLEEAVRMLPVPTFLLNVVTDAADRVIDAVAGDLALAFRAGAATCRAACEVTSARADVVVVSAALPLSGSLYQASKLLAPAGMLLRPGGVAVLAAECPFGTGPLDVVNAGIYELGIRHAFPEKHTIFLVSALSEATVRRTYCRYAPSVEDVLARHVGDLLVLPDAGNVVPRILE